MKYIALDVGNVCVKIDRDQFIKALGATPEMPEVAEKAQGFFALAQKFEFGQLTETQFFEQAQKLLFPHDAVSATTIRLAFNEILRCPMPGMVELVADLKAAGIGVAFFSDVSVTHLELFRRRFPGAAELPGTYSFEVGCWKPGVAMFQDFEAKFGKPLLYTDDRAELIEAAAAYGWNAKVFRSAEALRKELL